MRIKIGKGIYVDSRTLIRLEWRKFTPVLVVHEKFENKIKWILRVLAIIGIATSIISIDKWYYSLGLALCIFLIEQLFEKTVFEYTTLLFMKFPDFSIDYSKWKTNGFMIPAVISEQNLCYAGPTYSDKEYAVKFFDYIKSWNNGSNIDNEGNINFSLVLEPDENYSTYLYPNPNKSELDKIFKHEAESKKLDKYGKKQQELIGHMLFWNTLPYKDGSYIKMFLEAQKPNEKFYLTPSVIPKQNDGKAEFLFDSAILKFSFKFKKRNELTKKDVEFYHPPEK